MQVEPKQWTEQWDWKQEEWKTWGSWDSWDSSGDRGWWGSAYQWWGDKNWGASSQPSVLQNILQRGHTVDQLEDWQLQEVAASIDHFQKEKKNKEGEKKNTVEAAAKAATDEPAAASSKQAEQETPTQQAAQSSEKDTALEGETEEQKAKQEKLERKKRLHARNMRYYRSLASHLAKYDMEFDFGSELFFVMCVYIQGPNCPKEIKKLAERAKGDSGQRSYLFEHWLLAEGNWCKSKLLVRLRSKHASKKKGMRRWYTRTELVQKNGETIADAMIEEKLADDEKRETEVRNHPDCPSRKDLDC